MLIKKQIFQSQASNQRNCNDPNPIMADITSLTFYLIFVYILEMFAFPTKKVTDLKNIDWSWVLQSQKGRELGCRMLNSNWILDLAWPFQYPIDIQQKLLLDFKSTIHSHNRLGIDWKSIQVFMVCLKWKNESLNLFKNNRLLHNFKQTITTYSNL